MKDILIHKINKSDWWHVPPLDPDAYKKRGKFLASTYLQAAFYGRPSMEPERVEIKNPVLGFSESDILEELFGLEESKLLKLKDTGNVRKDWYEQRIGLDAKMYQRAKQMGYDAIILLGSNARKYLLKNRKPHSIELNLIW